MIVGVTSNDTPNALNSIVVVGTPFDVVELTGTGNSPPAKKEAGCPFVAVKLGSASVVKRFSCASAWSVARVCALPPPRTKPIMFWLVILLRQEIASSDVTVRATLREHFLGGTGH